MVDRKLLTGNVGVKGRFCLNQSNRVLAEGSPVIRHHPGDGGRWETWLDIEGNQTEDVGFLLNWISRIFAKIEQCKDKHGSSKVEA